MPSADQDLPASVTVHDPQLLTNPMPGSDVVDPCSPLPKTAQHPSASMMPSSDVMDPKLTLPDAVALTAQPDKVDTSTPSAVKAVGNGSSVDPIIEPPLSMPELFVLPVSSYCSLPEKKKSSAICIQAPQLQQGK